MRTMPTLQKNQRARPGAAPHVSSFVRTAKRADLPLLALCAALTLAACSAPQRASVNAEPADSGAHGDGIAQLVDRDGGPKAGGDAQLVDVITPDAPDAAQLADAAQLVEAGADAAADAAQLVDAGPVYTCDPGRLDCDGVAANGCEILVWDAGCAGLSANGQRCVDCVAGQLCACGALLSGDPKCATVCD